MSKLHKKSIVYSTNPNWKEEQEDNDSFDSLAPHQHKLRVRLETKQRAGKKATVIQGFNGSEDELEVLAKSLKTKLGTGGSAKEGEIIIQGDYVTKVKTLLILMGYKDTK